MKKTYFRIALLIFISLLACQLSTVAQQEKSKDEKTFTSLWEGKLKINSAVSLRLVLKTFNNEDGSLNAYMDSPDQGKNNIPVTSVTMSEDSLKFAVKNIGLTYSGKIIKDSAMVKGVFKQSTLVIPLDLKKIEKLVEIKRPQEPAKPYPYNDEEVTFENKEANITLAGSFTYPKEGTKFPAVVLVTGSGAQDRDETLAGGINHKPFLVLSDYLTRNGIAVLRFDDRGVAKSKGNFATATTADFATDALAAVEYLKTRKEVDPKKIGVAGHSEGGLIAPMTAANSNDVNFVVMLAGPGLPGKDILLLQGKLIAKADGEKEDKIEKSIRLNEKMYDAVLGEENNEEAAKKLKALYDEFIQTLAGNDKKEAEEKKPTLEQGLKQLTSPWFRFFMKFDPRPVLESVSVPVLALNGEKDLQVPARENLAEIEKALKNGGNKNFKTVLLPGLNHLFQHAKTGSPSEYGSIEETFSPYAMKLMKDWILRVTK